MSSADDLPPHSEAAERNLLASLFASPEIADEVFTAVPPDALYFDHHQRVYRAMRAVAAAGRVIDLPAVSEQMAADRTDKDVRAEVVGDLARSMPFGFNWPMYAERVVELHRRRSVLRIAAELVRDVRDEVAPAAELADAAASALSAVLTAGSGETLVEMRQVFAECLRQIDERETGQKAYIPTGYAALDNYIGGFAAEKLYIIGARPGVGKTASAVNFALHAARHAPVLIFSMEMASYELGFRVLAINSRVDLTAVSGIRRLASDEVVAVAEAANHATPHGFYVDDRADLSAADIARTVRLAKKRYGVKLVVVDYLQRMKHDRRASENTAEVIEATAKALKTLARTERVPVVCLTQLNRQLENRPDPEPKMSDIRSSGGVEQEADVVMLLHPVDKPTATEQQLKVIIGKQRGGPVGEVILNYIRPYTKLED